MNIINSELNSNQFSITNLRRKLLQFFIVSFIAPSNISMMPLAPMSTELPTGHKPKIGFSIDSIVGEGVKESPQLANKSGDVGSQNASYLEHNSQNSATPSPEPSCIDSSEKEASIDILSRGSRAITAPFAQLHHHQLHHQLFRNNSDSTSNNGSNPSRPIPIRTLHPHQLHYPPMHHLVPQGSHSSSENSSPGIVSPSNSLSAKPNNISIKSRANKDIQNDNGSNNPESTSPPILNSSNNSRSPSPNNESRKSPPLNSQDPPNNQNITCASRGTLSTITEGDLHPSSTHLLPHAPSLGHQAFPPFAGYPPGMLNFAAAAAAAAAAQNHPPPPGLPAWMHPPHHPPTHHPHPLYPWLLAKHSRLFPHRFGPGPDLPGFLLQPFRKPKRIRTAFSPSQLLKLEHAFERNHYVVGAERKQLANSLSLSETQVKVWFQNRRTKHKRMQQEEESVKKSGGGSGNGNGSSSDLPSSVSNLSSSAISADSSTRNYSEEISDDEEIIMDEDYSDEEEMHMEQLHRLNMTS